MIRLSYVDIDVYTLFNEHVSAISERFVIFHVCVPAECVFSVLFHRIFNLLQGFTTYVVHIY